MYKGIGVQDDPFESFRKNRSGVFIQKLKDRDEQLAKLKKQNGMKVIILYHNLLLKSRDTISILEMKSCI